MTKRTGAPPAQLSKPKPGELCPCCLRRFPPNKKPSARLWALRPRGWPGVDFVVEEAVTAFEAYKKANLRSVNGKQHRPLSFSDVEVWEYNGKAK